MSANQLYEISKQPPQATDLEEAVLGAIMLERDAMQQVCDILHDRSFYKEAHGRIFGAVIRLHQKSAPIDILTVTQELRRTGELDAVGGAYYISQLTNRVASSSNVEFHARIVAQKFILREIIRIGSDAVRMGYDESVEDVFTTLDRIQNDFFTIEKTYSNGKAVEKLRDLLAQEREEYFRIEALAQTQGVVGINTGFKKLNQMTGGWQAPDLIILAARPAMGKTALALALSTASAISGNAVAIFSLEMSSLQLVKRQVQSESEVNSYQYRNALLDDNGKRQLEIARGRLEDLGVWIDDTPALSITEFRSKARRLVQKNGVKMIIVDYLQLMTTGEDRKYGSNREREISSISAALKRTAKELSVPVIALSQLSRAVETRGGDKRPQLSDLRESGAIEQDADMVIFIHRPEYYGITQDAEGHATAGRAQLIIAKHRNGPTGDVNVGFVDRFTKFWDIEAREEMPTNALQPNTEFIHQNNEPNF